MFLRVSFLMLALIQLACGQQTTTPTSETTATATTQPASSTTGLTGLDISQYQGTVDFAQVKAAGASFVFAKATQGDTVVDPLYATNYAGARAAGLVVGAYHYYMTDDEPADQFDNFSAAVSLVSGDLPPVVDIEALASNTLPDLQAELQQFLDTLEQKYGVKPIIYTGENFANANLAGFDSYPLWLAEYSAEPILPSGWSSWTFWQWSQSGTIAGVEGDVDQDRFAGSLSDLKKLLIP